MHYQYITKYSDMQFQTDMRGLQTIQHGNKQWSSALTVSVAQLWCVAQGLLVNNKPLCPKHIITRSYVAHK